MANDENGILQVDRVTVYYGGRDAARLEELRAILTEECGVPEERQGDDCKMKKPELAWLKDLGEKLRPLAHRYRAVLIVLLAGMLLLASGGWFGGGGAGRGAADRTAGDGGFDLAVFEQDLNESGDQEGVGRVELMLSLDQTKRRYM